MCGCRKCALSGMSHLCRHRIKLGDKENYYYISPSSRARVQSSHCLSRLSVFLLYTQAQVNPSYIQYMYCSYDFFLSFSDARSQQCVTSSLISDTSSRVWSDMTVSDETGLTWHHLRMLVNIRIQFVLPYIKWRSNTLSFSPYSWADVLWGDALATGDVRSQVRVFLCGWELKDTQILWQVFYTQQLRNSSRFPTDTLHYHVSDCYIKGPEKICERNPAMMISIGPEWDFSLSVHSVYNNQDTSYHGVNAERVFRLFVAAGTVYRTLSPHG